MKRLILAAALTACVSNAKFTPASGPAGDDAFSKAVRVLVERGHAIETKDEAAGVIVTKWDEGTQMGSEERLRWTVTIADGRVTAVSQCQFRLEDPAPGQDNSWQQCSVQPEARNAEAKAIVEAVK